MHFDSEFDRKFFYKIVVRNLQLVILISKPVTYSFVEFWNS